MTMTAESLVRSRIDRAMADIRELANDFGFSDETILFQKINLVGKAFDNAADRYFEEPPLQPHARAVTAHNMVTGAGKTIQFTATQLNISTSTVRRWLDLVTEFRCWQTRQAQAHAS